MKMHHIYPALLQKKEETYTLSFPDFPEISLTFEDVDQERILISAREALGEQIFKMESEGQELPKSEDLFSLGKKESEIILLVGVHMRRYYMEQKAIKKTLTVPNWLNDLAEEEGINFSHLLQQSLVEELRFREGMVREFHRGGHPHFHHHEEREGLREHLRNRSRRVNHDRRGDRESDCDCGGDHFHEGHHHGFTENERSRGSFRENFEEVLSRRRPGRPPHNRE